MSNHCCYNGYMHRLVLERGYRKKGGGMSGRHIAIHTWLEALGLQSYLPLFFNYGGVEDLLYASEAEVRDLGLKNSAHRAKVVSSLRILREKYEKGKSTGSGVFALQQPRSPTSPTGVPIFPDFPPVIASPEKLQQDLQRELHADASELKSRAWYHGNVTRQRAESLVSASGDFLVRDSISKPGDFVLTCCWRGVALHFVVNALVGDCAPGSLPTIAYQFEDESFGSIQELIQFYLTRLKPVTVASGAVLRNPVPRSMPLSYYDAKYGAAHYNPDNNGGGHYTPSQSPKPSPFCTPETSPRTSPVMNRRAYKRTGSQPLLNVVDDYEVDRSRSPSLERFGSLPVINIIPPGGPGSVGGERFHHHHHHHHHHPHGGGGDSAGEGRTGPAPIVAHQRSGSAPVLMNDDLVGGGGGGDGGGGRGGGGGLSYTQSARMAPAGSESNLSRAPPPKPSRIPSIKYKKRPVVVVRNPELYEQDDGRDYTDPDQLTGPPSWAQPPGGGAGDHVGVPRIVVGGSGGGGMDLEPDTTTPPFPPYNPAAPPPPSSLSTSSPVTKSHSFQGSKSTGSEESIYDNNFNNLNKGYQTLPVKSSRTAKQGGVRPRLSSASSDPFSTSNIIAANNDNCRLLEAEERDPKKITMPGFNLGSRLNLDSFSTGLFPARDNRLLEPSAVMQFKHLLLSSNARAIAGHVTKVDLEVLRVSQEDDLGVGVTSGIELCTLPQGDQLRNDIIERCECQRLFVMTSLMTCNAVTERAKMLSQWIETAGELRSSMGNLFSFASVMEALSAPQVHRLRDTWMILRQKHTSSAYLFDTKLKTLLKSINEGSGLLPLTNITVPNLTPVVLLLHRDLDECGLLPNPGSFLQSWESSDPNLGLDFLLSHLDIARIVASQTGMYRRAAAAVLSEVKVDGELEAVCRTEFQMRLMWGSKGARAPRAERISKFEQLLGVLSERLEAPGDDGTEV